MRRFISCSDPAQSFSYKEMLLFSFFIAYWIMVAIWLYVAFAVNRLKKLRKCFWIVIPYT